MHLPEAEKKEDVNVKEADNNRATKGNSSLLPAIAAKFQLPFIAHKHDKQSRQEQEFLPAALEILETPPSPIKIAIIYSLSALVFISLIWSFFSYLDIIAVAQGKIQPPGRVKIIQPTETAKVLKIGAQNGDKVKQGDVLVLLDPADASADLETSQAACASFEAEIIRRDVAIRIIQAETKEKEGDAFKNLSDIAKKELAWKDDIPHSIRMSEMHVFQADIAQFESSIASIRAQIEQKSRERDRLSRTIEAQEELVKTLQQRVDMRATLAKSGFGSRASLIDGKEVLQKEETNIAIQRGQLLETDAALQVLAKEINKQKNQFVADYTQKRSEAARNLDASLQKLSKTKARLDNMTLKSPVDGIVQSSTLFTIGQVVTTGQEIMRVVPIGEKLEVEAYLQNKDIGFVREGQEARIKVESFPFTRYGVLRGVVKRVAKDAIPLPEAMQTETNPAKSNDSQSFGGAQRTQNLFFQVIISLDDTYLMVDGQSVPMSPGMSVTAEITTGSRRLLEYLFSPLLQTTSEALKER